MLYAVFTSGNSFSWRVVVVVVVVVDKKHNYCRITFPELSSFSFFAALARIRAASKRLRVERTREVTIARDKLACFYSVLRVSVLLCVSYARILTLNPVLYRWYIRAHN